jgi:uncharacterized repeat protein (TIGR01451 family)
VSRRLPALTLMATLLLVAAGLGAPLLAGSASGFGEHVFQANPVVGPGDPYYGVYSENTLAQSFLVSQDYVLTNVTLRVRNDGGPTSPLVVTIRNDDPVRHIPDMSSQLAFTSQVSPNNHPGPDNWSFPFNPSPLLQAGTVYWIVAQSSASQAPPADGYEWHESNGDTYPGGSAYLINTTTGVPTGLPYDLYFITYGKEWNTNVSVAMTASRAQAQPGNTVMFTVNFNNTGMQNALWVWLNTTVPSTFVNVSLAFPEIQPVSAGAFPNLTFQNLPNGAHSFTMTGQIAIGTPPGTVTSSRASLDFQNTSGVLTRGERATASVLVGLVTKQLYLSGTGSPAGLLTTAPTGVIPANATLNPGAAQPLQFLLAPRLARPFQSRNVSVSLWLSTQKAPPQSYRLNVSLLDNGTPVVSLDSNFTLSAAGYHLVSLSFGAVNHTFPYGHQIGLSLLSDGGGSGSTDKLLLAYNSTACPSRLDLVTTTYVAVDDLAVIDPVTNGTLWSPLDPIVVLANVSDPFGSGKILGAWINITSPTGQQVAAAAMGVRVADASGLPAWIEFNYTLRPPLETGAYRVDVQAMEDNGVVDLAESAADVTVPVFSFIDVTSVGRSHASGSFAYYLYYNNSGTGPADRVWINDTLPSIVTYVSSSPTYNFVSGDQYQWVLDDVPTGTHVLEIDVTVPSTSVVPAWIQDNATLTSTDTTGHRMGTLSAHAIVFLNGPILTVSLSSSPGAIIHANQTLVYTVALQNTGADSGTVWLNNTLPSNFTFVRDTAISLGGTRTRVGSALRYTFPSMGADTAEAFQIVLTAPAELVRNATCVDTAGVTYESTNGYLMPPETASLSSLAVAPWFPQAGVTFLQPRASTGAVVPAVIRLWNVGNEAAPWTWINLTLDTRLTPLNASAPFAVGPGTEEFVLQNVSVGLTAIYLNFTVGAGTADGAVLQILGTLEAQDGFGNPVSGPAFTGNSVIASTAAFTLSVTPASPVIESGTTFPLAIALHNTGSRAAANAWLNVTIPGSLGYLYDTSGIVPTVVGTSYSWHWATPNPTLQAGGTETFNLSLQTRIGTPNGTATDVVFRLDYQNANYLGRAAVGVTVHATIIAPALVLTLDASQLNVPSGGTLNYTIRIANRGLTIAKRVWIEDRLDSRILLINYASSVDAITGPIVSWMFTYLAPGHVETINLTVSVSEGLPAQTLIANSIEANYTNSAGIFLGSLRSQPVTIEIAQDGLPILWILAAAVAIGAVLLFLVRRRSNVEIEDVFLVYRDGVLISHLSRTLLREKDEDVLSGMLTAVQEFVREAFQYGEHHELHQLDFGDYRILIERGAYVYLAVVYSGLGSARLQKKVHAVIDQIEEQFGAVLEKWDGDMEQVVGAGDVLRDTLLGSSNHNRVAASTPHES